MRLVFSLSIALSIVGVSLAGEPPGPLTKAFEKMTPSGLLEHIRVLASDEFEGRGPATLGEEKSVAYIAGQFKKLGLEPGNPSGGYFQMVPLVGFNTKAKGEIKAKGKTFELQNLRDWVAVSRRLTTKSGPRKESLSNLPLVFVGYGVSAPEYGWDDYKDVDVKGKVLLMLINDPAVPDPSNSAKLDPKTFKGDAMTYYGRWTYKYEIATEKGDAGVIIIHEEKPAGYPFEVVLGSWGRENFDIPSDSNAKRPLVESSARLSLAKEILKASGLDFDALKKAAVKRDFKPVALNATASFEAEDEVRFVDSKNVVAKIEGGDPKLKDEYVVYSAHWDHLGKDDKLSGDQIFNGAVDNASGVASILQIAAGIQALEPKPKRSVLFLALTAEEKGLLGEVLRQEPALPALEDSGQHQHRRYQRLGKNQGHREHRPGDVDARLSLVERGGNSVSRGQA